jgi:hypothetical protein
VIGTTEPLRDIDREHAGLTDVAGGGVEGRAVLGPLQAVGRTIPVGGDLAGLAGRDVTQEDRIFVGLEARAGHGAIGQGLAVRREDRARVPGVVGLGQVGELVARGQARV